MAASSTGARKAFVVIAAIVILLAAGLTAGWYYLANEIDRRVAGVIEAAKANGVTLTCANRSVFGYPFRLGLHCDATGIDAPQDGIRATMGTLRTAAQIYEPTRIVAELDSPAYLQTPNLPPLDLRWTLGQASAKFGSEGVGIMAVSLDQPVIALSRPAADRLPIVEADHIEFHARRRDGDLDLAFSNLGTEIVAPGVPQLPAFDASGDLTVDGAAGWLSGAAAGSTPAEALVGRTGTIRSVQLDFGEAEAELSGTFGIGEDGEVSGDFELAVAEPQRVAEIVADLIPQLAPIASSVATGIGFIGRQVDGRTVVPLTVEDGKISAGMFPLGSIPPIR